MKKKIKKTNVLPKIIIDKKSQNKDDESIEQKRKDEKLPLNFNKIKISLATPEQIREWSWGEVINSETINYRTFVPEKGGLFCPVIFGPTKNHECLCGKYKTTKFKKRICNKCKVQIGNPQVRRTRLGHIELNIYIAHIWYFKSLPSRLGLLLNLNVKQLEKIIYYDAYIVINKGSSSCQNGQMLTEQQYSQIISQSPKDLHLIVGMGAQAIRTYLKSLDLQKYKEELINQYKKCKLSTIKKKLYKQIIAINSFTASKNKIDGLFIKALPVLPPDLRPLVPLDGGRFATSDLNDLYRRIININNRIKRLKYLGSSETVLKHNYKLLQQAVDGLLDNSRTQHPFLGKNKRPYKSLYDSLKGKQGRFRLNLLGKRVDYSGRTVITVGPHLKLNQCGIPKKMLLELFKSFIIERLTGLNLAPSMKVALKMLKHEDPSIWKILEDRLKLHPVLLNRAPTLHRLGIQAFEVNMIEGKAIQLHPLVCGGFNADFDGDQMAVHIPITIEAQLEARHLMMADNNILSPANGEPNILPSQDIILGLHYLTIMNIQKKTPLKIITSYSDAQYLYENKLMKLHDQVTYLVTEYTKFKKYFIKKQSYIQTTIGRSILWEIIPKGLRFDLINKTLTKQSISHLLRYCYMRLGKPITVQLEDDLKQIGFKFCTKAGISICLNDMKIPKEKKTILNRADQNIQKIKTQFKQGLLTNEEKFNKIIEVWTLANNELTGYLMKNLSKLEGDIQSYNSIYMMAASGARGSSAQIKQLAGMRGLMTKPDGSIIEEPIKNNLREGLTINQYFLSSHGARKGLADTALKTANSGYLTRRLVDVVQDVVITEEDCQTSNCFTMHIKEKFQPYGRMTAENIMIGSKVLIRKDILLLYPHCNLLAIKNITTIKVRSVMNCATNYGICASCYGADLSTCKLINLGAAIGVIAAQSIGEPGTQLTMRTFHVGGTANISISKAHIQVNNTGFIVLINSKHVFNKNNNLIIYSRNTKLQIVDNKKVLETYELPYGSIIKKSIGDRVIAGEIIAEWDHNYKPIICEEKGYIKYVNLIEGKNCRTNINYINGEKIYIVKFNNNTTLKNRPYLKIVNQKGDDLVLKGTDVIKKYFLPHKSIIQLSNGSLVNIGDILAHFPITYETTDITGGLPKIEELFEARKFKNSAILAELSGIITIPTKGKNKFKFCIDNMKGKIVVMKIPMYKYFKFEEGDYVHKGEVLTDGAVSSHDVLRLNGIKYFTKFFIKAVQKIYKKQGVHINEKHIEVILKQLLRTVTINESGHTGLIVNDIIPIEKVKHINKLISLNKLKPAKYSYNLLGITKGALSNESFISSASFQDTAKVLTASAFTAKIDELKGLKENVIIGRLIPAGTGFFKHINKKKKRFRIVYTKIQKKNFIKFYKKLLKFRKARANRQTISD